MRLRRVAGHLLPLPPTTPRAPAGSAQLSSEIDAQCWSIISEAVAANDCEKMASVYHPDAVLVSTAGSIAVAAQLVTWGQGMEKITTEGRRASVSFRFSSRQGDPTTAFERGIFRYAETDAAGVEEPRFVYLEALFVKKEGRWLMVMERQLEAADEGAWDALPA
jgi:ketosteroid isomerase-like protein